MSSQNVKLYFSAEEDEKLTESVRKHPALYDMQHALYRDTRVKDNIWKEIAEYVARSVADCKKRWKNIKDTYDRKKREKTPTGSQAEPEKKRKKWQLAEKLSFLQSVDNQRKSISNIPSCSEDAATEDVREEETDGSQRSDFFEPNNKECTPTTSVYTTPLPSVNAPPETSDRPVKKVVPYTTKTKYSHKENRDRFASLLERRDKERNQIFKHLVAEKEDDVDLFFKSIAKSVKRLRPDLRTQAKLQCLTLVANLENQTQNSQWVPYTSFTSQSTPATTYFATNVASPPTIISSVEYNSTYDTQADASFANV